MGQKDGEKWTAAGTFWPTLLLPRTLLGDCQYDSLTTNKTEMKIEDDVSNLCTQCGNQNEISSKFCFSCESPLVNHAETESPVMPSTASPSQHARPAPQPGVNTETPQISANVRELTGVGGWLAFLVLAMMVFGPITGLVALVNLYHDLEPIFTSHPAFEKLFNTMLVFTAANMAWSIFVGYRLAKAHPGAPTLAKWYFILNPIVFVGQSYFLLSIEGLPQENAVVAEMMFDFVSAVGSSIIWYQYLVRSKRVLYTFPNPSTHVHCPDCRKLVFAKSAVCPHCEAKLIPQ